MYIEYLRIEHFGHLSDVCADGLHRPLSVLYCSRDSERDDVRDFLRWLLFGANEASQLDSRMHGADETRVCGSMRIRQGDLRRQVTRLNDGTRYGRLSIDGLRDEPAGDATLQIGRITPHEFDVVFAPRLDLDPHPDQLLDAVRSANLDMSSRRIPSEHHGQLRARLEQLRSEHDHSPWIDSVAQLLERRDVLTRRIEQATQQRQRQDLDSEYRDVSQRIEQIGQETDFQHREYQVHDDEVTRRRHELEEAWRVAQQAKELFLRQRREEFAEFETRANRWQGILHEVQTRLAAVDDQLRQRPQTLGPLAEPTCLVANLAARIDRLRHDVANRKDHARSSDGSLYETNACHAITDQETRTALDALRREVSRLCRTLQDHRQTDKLRWFESEVDCLRQCETVMTSWLAKLEKQRDHLQRELSDVEHTGLSLVDDDMGVANCIDWDGQYREPYAGRPYPDVHDNDSIAKRITSRKDFIRAVAHSCGGYDVAHPDTDSPLRTLIDRRDAVTRELESLKRTADSLVAERGDLDERIARRNNRKLDDIRRELQEVESSLRVAEKRERLAREIAQVQDELRPEKDQLHPTPVAVEASRFLHQLTQGRFNRIRIDDSRHVTVDDARGSAVNLHAAARELRGDVYLAICLALVATYHREGIKLPLVMIDPFLLTNAGHDATRAAVIHDFAREGHQVLMLTSRRDVADLFRGFDVTFVELQPDRDLRPLPSPSPEPLPERRFTETERDSEFEDHVRFKRRARSTPPESEPVEHAARPLTPMTSAPTETQVATKSEELVGQHVEAAKVPAAKVPAAKVSVNRGKTTRVAADLNEEKHSPALSFLLDSSDPLVDAPSIGPRTAAHFQKIGVQTVAEFLRLNPDDAAAKIDNRRIRADTIRQWQKQAAMACRIPELHAHDAQILVACGVKDPTELARMEPTELWSRVKPFIKTAAGKRIIRKGESPDSNKVEDWISMAKKSRTMKAA